MKKTCVIPIIELRTTGSRNLKVCTLANGKDPDKSLQCAPFYQCLHCLLRQNESTEKEIIVWLWTF